MITEFIYDIVKYALPYLGECDGYKLYGLGTCVCLTTDSEISLIVIETKMPDLTVDIEIVPPTAQENVERDQIPLKKSANPAGFPRIRKSDKKLYR